MLNQFLANILFLFHRSTLRMLVVQGVCISLVSFPFPFGNLKLGHSDVNRCASKLAMSAPGGRQGICLGLHFNKVHLSMETHRTFDQLLCKQSGGPFILVNINVYIIHEHRYTVYRCILIVSYSGIIWNQLSSPLGLLCFGQRYLCSAGPLGYWRRLAQTLKCLI